MLKASLFQNLFEAGKAKSKKNTEAAVPEEVPQATPRHYPEPYKPLPAPTRPAKSRIFSKPEEPEVAPEDTISLRRANRKKAGIKPEKGRIVQDKKDHTEEFTTLANKARESEVAAKEAARVRQAEETELKKAADPTFGLTAAEKIIANKAHYGTVYTKNRATVEDLRGDIENLPFRVPPKFSSALTKELREIFQSPEIIEAAGSSAGIGELSKLLLSANNFPLSSTGVGEFNNYAYPFYAVFVLPLIPAGLATSLFKHPNVIAFFNELSKNYRGNLLEPVNFEDMSDFTSADYIKDGDVKAMVHYLQEILRSDDDDWAEIKHALAVGIDEASKGLHRGIRGTYGGGKQLNEVARTIYYTMLSKYLPFNADLFEMDNRVAQDLVADAGRTPDFTPFLTPNANTLIRSRIENIAENPMLHKGTLGQNLRNSLAFQYAKATTLLQKKRQGTDLAKAETQEKISRASLSYFADDMEAFPAISSLFSKIEEVFSGLVFSENPGLPTDDTEKKKAISNKVEAATNSLHQLATSGKQLLDDLASSVDFTSIFSKLLRKYPELARTIPAENREAYITQVYIETYRDTLNTRLTEFEAVTKEDMEILFSTAAAIVECEGKMISIGKMKQAVEAYDKHLQLADLHANDNRLQGFIELRKILSLESLLVKARRLVKKTPKKDLESAFAEKSKKERNAAKEYLENLTRARKNILDSKQLLNSLAETAFYMFLDIRQHLTSADTEILTSLVSGIASKEQEEKLGAFFDSIIQSVASSYFTDYFKDDSSLLLLALNEVNPSIINAYIKEDLLEKAKQSLLATDGVLVSKVEYYSGLTDDFINFINLAASIKSTYSGLKLVNGEPDLTFDIDPTSNTDSFFGSFFFGDLPSQIESSTAIKLCMHKFILNKFKNVAGPLLSKVSAKSVLLPETVKRNPEAARQIDKYFKDLYSAATTGLKTALNEINHELITSYGGQTVSLVSKTGETPRSYIIPDETNAEFEKRTLWLGNLALDILRRDKNVKAASQKFVNTLSFVSLEQETPSTSVIAPHIENAIDIISTAINLKAAKNAMLGDDKSEQTIVELIKKYQQENNTEGAADIFDNESAAKMMLAKFAEESGFAGTEFITQKDNRVKNPLLASILDKFDGFISFDSVERRLQKYSISQKEMADAGETDTASLISTIVNLIGIAYSEIVLPDRDATKEIKSTTEEENVINTPAEHAAGNEDLFDRSNARVIKFKLLTAQSISKDMEPRVAGFSTTALGRNKKHGSNVIQVQTYPERIAALISAVSGAASIYRNFYASCGAKEVGRTVVTKANEAIENCEKLIAFFEEQVKSSTTGTNSIYNIGTQKALFEILKSLNSNAPLLVRDLSSVVVSGTASLEDNPLPDLLADFDTESKKVETRLHEVFTSYKGSEHVFRLIKRGLSLTDILHQVNNILLEQNDDPDFLNLADSSLEDEVPEENTYLANTASDIASHVSSVNIKQATVADFLASLKMLPQPLYFAPKLTKTEKDGRVTVTRPSQMIANPDFANKYVTVADRTLQLPTSPATDEEKKLLKAAAMRFETYLVKSPKIKLQIMDFINSGKAYNRITGDTVSVRNLMTPDQLKEGFGYTELAVLLLEAEMTTQQETSNTDIMLSLAAILRLRYKVTGSERGLLDSTGKPFTFETLQYLAWALRIFDTQLDKYLSVIHRYTGGNDTLTFIIDTGKKHETKIAHLIENRAYVKLFQFNKLKALVDTYYKPTEATTETPEVK